MTPKPPQAVNMTLNLAPMVDVMMCLIIFFLLGSRLVSESQPIELPDAQAAEQLTAAPELTQVTVNVAVDEQLRPQYTVAVGRGSAVARAVNAEDLAGFLLQEAERSGHPDQVRCAVRGDREAPYAAIETVLRACGQAGISRVVFGATPVDGGDE